MISLLRGVGGGSSKNDLSWQDGGAGPEWAQKAWHHLWTAPKAILSSNTDLQGWGFQPYSKDPYLVAKNPV